MIKLHLDKGLNDEQVQRNRKVYGDNCAAFSGCVPFKARFLASLSHLFSIIMFALIAVTFVVALKLNENDQIGQKVFAMPIACALATLFIVFIGAEGGFKRKGFLILTVLSVLQLGTTVYEYILSDSDISVFYYHLGLFLLILFTVALIDIFHRKRIKCQFLLNKHEDETLYKVIRNKSICLVNRSEIVVGDLIIIHNGEIVPADCEIIEAINLQIDGSVFHVTDIMRNLSGENDSSHNHSATENLLFRGMRITKGYCVVKVVKVGNSVSFLEQTGSLKFKESDNSFLHVKTSRLAIYFKKVTFVVALLFCCVRLSTFFFGGGLDEQMTDRTVQASKTIIDTFMIVAMMMIIADKSILSNTCNSTIAFNLRYLIKKGFIPYSGKVCYDLAATDVVCLDATKFLSNNLCKVAFSSFLNISQERMAEMIAANTNAYIVSDTDNNTSTWGDSIEIAMLRWLNDKYVDYIALRNNVVFVDRRESVANHSLATIVKSEDIPGKHLVYVKGDPDFIMSLTDMTLAEINQCKTQLYSCWKKGWKTVAFAFGIIEENENPFDDDALCLHNMNFAGFLAFEFSHSADLEHSLSSIVNSDVDLCFFTHDNEILATSLANRFGIPVDTELVDNKLAEGNDDSHEKGKYQHVNLVCLHNSHNKHDLVNKLKSDYASVALYEQTVHDQQEAYDKNCIVLTTDKLSERNDDMVKLTDSSVSSVYNAIISARTLVKNVRFFLLYYFTISATIFGILLWSAFYVTDFPISSMNLLWVYILLNFIALPALTLLPNSILRYSVPFRATDKLFTKNMILHAVFFAGIMFLVLVGCLFIIKYNNLHSLYNFFTVNLPHNQGVNPSERSIFFMAVCLFMFWQLFNIRTFRDEANMVNIISGHKFFLWLAFLLLVSSFCLLQFAGFLFHSSSLHVYDWAVAIVVTSAVLWMNELFFLLARNKFVIITFAKRQATLMPTRIHKFKLLLTKSFKYLFKWTKSAGRMICHLFKQFYKLLCKMLIKIIDFLQHLKK